MRHFIRLIALIKVNRTDTKTNFPIHKRHIRFLEIPDWNTTQDPDQYGKTSATKTRQFPEKFTPPPRRSDMKYIMAVPEIYVTDKSSEARGLDSVVVIINCGSIWRRDLAAFGLATIPRATIKTVDLWRLLRHGCFPGRLSAAFPRPKRGNKRKLLSFLLFGETLLFRRVRPWWGACFYASSLMRLSRVSGRFTGCVCNIVSIWLFVRVNWLNARWMFRFVFIWICFECVNCSVII